MKGNYNTFGTVNHKYYTIELRPTTKCNYNCYYCTDLHINSNPIINISIEHIQYLITKAKASISKPLHVFICGGEPTMYPGLIDLVNGITEVFTDVDYVTIQTNMSKKLKWFEHFVESIDTRHVKINGSYHNTQPTCNITDVICKCILLRSHNVLGVVSFGYNKIKNVKDDYLRAREVVGDQYCEIVPLINNRVDQKPNIEGSGNDIDHLYEVEDMSEFEQYGHFFQHLLKCETRQGDVKFERRSDLWLRRDNNFLGSKCHVSKFKLYVDWDGNCYNCFNKQYTDLVPDANISDKKSIDQYYTKLGCIDCKFTTCFFDLEYKKERQDKQVDEVLLNRKYNTHEYRKTNVK
jgi:organic radical activating enzyme